MQITDAELQIMRVLWNRSPLGAAEIIELLGAQSAWSPRTVKTLLARLVEKGALSTEPEGRRFLYTPQIAQKAWQASTTTNFVNRVFGGRAAPLVAHLADMKNLSADDLADLEALIQELKDVD